MNLTPYSHLKVLVRDSAIFVSIELVEQLLELSIGDVSKAPVLEIELKLFWLNAATLLRVHIHKSLSQSFPLELYLL